MAQHVEIAATRSRHSTLLPTTERVLARLPGDRWAWMRSTGRTAVAQRRCQPSARRRSNQRGLGTEHSPDRPELRGAELRKRVHDVGERPTGT